jgi:hypothetical protein
MMIIMITKLKAHFTYIHTWLPPLIIEDSHETQAVGVVATEVYESASSN